MIPGNGWIVHTLLENGTALQRRVIAFWYDDFWLVACVQTKRGTVETIHIGGEGCPHTLEYNTSAYGTAGLMQPRREREHGVLDFPSRVR